MRSVLLLLLLALPAAADDRSIEIVRYACGSEFGRRDITLFKNGTLRVFQGAWNDQHMHLTEIGPDAVADNIQVLAEARASADVMDISPSTRGVYGEWMERCQLVLTLPEAEPLLSSKYAPTTRAAKPSPFTSPAPLTE